MDYLVVDKPCALFKDEMVNLMPNVPYEICGVEGAELFYNNKPAMLVNFSAPNVIKLTHAGENYFLLNLKDENTFCFNHFMLGNVSVDITLTSTLVVCMDGAVVASVEVEGLTYLGYEQVQKHLVIYFEGKRKFCVIVKDKQLKWADYYDEINTGEEFYLLKRLKDQINHGRVAKIAGGQFSSYLVYLDNLELNLQPQFTPLIFLDLFKAGNYKYCNNLLCADLQQTDPKTLKDFLPAFTQFFPFDFNCFALINHRTPVALVTFELADKITNIIIE